MKLSPNLLPGELYPRVSLASFMVEPPGNRFSGFPVPGINIYLVTRGRVKFRHEDGTFHFGGPGDLITFYRGRHDYEAVGSEALASYETHFLAAGPPRWNGIPVLPGIGRLPELINVGPRMPEFEAIFQRLMQTLVEHTITWEMESAACVLDLLQLAFKVVAGTEQKEKKTLSAWDLLLARIETHEERLSIREMAKALGYSTEHFIREFKKRYGLSPKRYVQSHRLERARRMILDGSHVKAAAAACGFSSSLHLNRTYKRYYKAPPSRLRRTLTAESSSTSIRPGLPVSRHIWAPGVDYNCLEKWFSSQPG